MGHSQGRVWDRWVIVRVGGGDRWAIVRVGGEDRYKWVIVRVGGGLGGLWG